VAASLLERWLEDVVRTPGLTGIGNAAEARRVLLEDALRARPLVEATSGTVVDVGSGGGSPGIPLAAALPDRDFVLLEAERRKCAFLERFATELGNTRVVWGRAEEQAVESFGVALAKALARPPVAVELCLPLVIIGGALVLWAGPSLERNRVALAATRLGGALDDEEVPGLLVVRKLGPTPPGFPRRPGMAKKRPLA
jgi:16S rRNA (guanine527-N7)-methyltransferase